jgi:PAS domain S-box-containing protein
MTSPQFQEVLAHLAAIIESAHDAVIGEDLDGTITSWNKGAEKLFGYTAEEIIGKSRDVLFAPDDCHEESQIQRRLFHGEVVGNFDTVRRRKDGHLIDVSLTLSPIKDDEGRVIGISKIAHDITERKQIELKLAHLAAIVESSDDAIVSVTLDRTIRSWNKGAERLFGYRAEEVLGQPTRLLVPDERADELPVILRILSNGGRLDHYETVRRHKDGRLINISMTVSPLRDQNGKLIGASAIARDISTYKWAEEAERRREAAANRLAILSAREREILAMVVAGDANKVIARGLDLSEKTIEKYRARLMKKLEVRNVAELIRLALSAEV